MKALDLVTVPPGEIELRDARSRGTRLVVLESFLLGRISVTASQWAAVAGSARSQDVSGKSTGNAPMHPVTWFDAVSWCNRASEAEGLKPAYAIHDRNVLWHPGADGYRLPTEAEWEWACRAGTTTPRYGELADIAWTAADEVEGPQDVAGKAPNGFGLFDMLGNVWEWCWDFADTARYGDYRSLRGGGWADPAWSCRASVRRGSAPDAVLEDVGFRVAREAVGTSGEQSAQGWSAVDDWQRAQISGPLPLGWTPNRELRRPEAP
ncbi:MAG: formylglycine-generating enzyme family protein [Paenarthrobacter sp.]